MLQRPQSPWQDPSAHTCDRRGRFHGPQVYRKYTLANHTRRAISFKCKISVWLFINCKAVYMVKRKLWKVHGGSKWRQDPGARREGIAAVETCRQVIVPSPLCLSPLLCPISSRAPWFLGEPPKGATLQLKMLAIGLKIWAFFI